MRRDDETLFGLASERTTRVFGTYWKPIAGAVGLLMAAFAFWIDATHVSKKDADVKFVKKETYDIHHADMVKDIDEMKQKLEVIHAILLRDSGNN